MDDQNLIAWMIAGGERPRIGGRPHAGAERLRAARLALAARLAGRRPAPTPCC